MFIPEEEDTSILGLRRKRLELNKQLRDLNLKIKQEEQRILRENLKSLPSYQFRVLEHLYDVHKSSHGGFFSYKRAIESSTGLATGMVTRATRALIRIGFIERDTTFTEDGELSGSGFGITKDGIRWFEETVGDPKDQAA